MGQKNNEIERLEKRISQLKSEIVMGNYYDGWTLKGMKKEYIILKDRLQRMKERE